MREHEITDVTFDFSSSSPPSSKRVGGLFSGRDWSLYSVYLIVLSVLFILLFNLVNLQLVEGNDNLYLSTAIRTEESIIYAPRGIVYDRNDVQLVSNIPAFKLALDPTQLPIEREEELINSLSELLDIPNNEIAHVLQEELYVDGERVTNKIITISRSVNRDKILSIYANLEDLPGIFIEAESKREYLYSEVPSHILGYVGEVSEDDLGSNELFERNDIVGKDGVEFEYDDVLRGINGKSITERNSSNEEVRILNPVEPIPGDNIQLTIDIEVQKKLVEYLEYGLVEYDVPAAAGVLMDIHTGEVIAMASLPDYNPNILIEGISNNDLNALLTDENLPFYNRVISSARPPGSTFKTITASAALSKGYLTPQSLIYTEGCYELGGGFEFCEAGRGAFGDINVRQALTVSSNIFFCKTMLEQRMPIDELVATASQDFYIGRITGIDLPGEVAGTMATRDLKEQTFNEPWYPGDSCNAAVGQGLTQVTPLQMSAWIASIANGGYRVTPHVVSEVIDNETNEISVLEVPAKESISVDGESLAIVREGMYEVVNDPRGSGWGLRGSNSDPAAKTGSAEVLRNVDGVFEPSADAWVTGFFPYDEPRYSFVVYLQYGGWGFESADVARHFLDWYVDDYNGLEQ